VRVRNDEQFYFCHHGFVCSGISEANLGLFDCLASETPDP